MVATDYSTRADPKIPILYNSDTSSLSIYIYYKYRGIQGDALRAIVVNNIHSQAMNIIKAEC